MVLSTSTASWLGQLACSRRAEVGKAACLIEEHAEAVSASLAAAFAEPELGR